MKKIFLIAAICLVSKFSLAQLNVSLVMVQAPPGTLMDWDNRTLTLFVSSAVGANYKALIKTEIKTLDGTVVGTTNLAKARTYNVGGNNTILYAADVLPLDVMIFNGKYRSSLDKTGKLPADNYMLCVQLVNPVDYRILSEQKCRNFSLAAYQLPIPVMPASESVLEIEKAQTAITFRWTPVSPRPVEVITYRVTVFEILENQTPMQALRSNQPLLAKDVMGTTQYIWQPQLGMTMCCKDGDVTGDGKMKTDSGGVRDYFKEPAQMQKDAFDAYAFIWTIQTFDQSGRPFGDGDVNGDGISEPNLFFVDRRPPAMRRSTLPSRTIYLNSVNTRKN